MANGVAGGLMLVATQACSSEPVMGDRESSAVVMAFEMPVMSSAHSGAGRGEVKSLSPQEPRRSSKPSPPYPPP
jgi:hypothetical protein